MNAKKARALPREVFGALSRRMRKYARLTTGQIVEAGQQGAYRRAKKAMQRHEVKR